MNEILTAKEWLEKEEINNSSLLSLTKFKDRALFKGEYDLSIILERYANYRNKILENKILDFRQSLKENSEYETSEAVEASYWLVIFDKIFDIKTEGKIN